MAVSIVSLLAFLLVPVCGPGSPGCSGCFWLDRSTGPPVERVSRICFSDNPDLCPLDSIGIYTPASLDLQGVVCQGSLLLDPCSDKARIEVGIARFYNPNRLITRRGCLVESSPGLPCRYDVTCYSYPPIFVDGFESGDTSFWSLVGELSN